MEFLIYYIIVGFAFLGMFLLTVYISPEYKMEIDNLINKHYVQADGINNREVIVFFFWIAAIAVHIVFWPAILLKIIYISIKAAVSK